MTRRNRPVVAGGAIITLVGIVHSAVAPLQVAPRHGGAWLDGALWEQVNRDVTEFTPVTGAFWYSYYSFGIPMLLLGVTVLSLGLRGAAAPRVVPWILMLWTVIGEIASGPSPLLLLVLAGVLMLVGAARPAAQTGLPDADAATENSESSPGTQPPGNSRRKDH
ncbi:DUF6463 family protein [Glycomyces terrestris]|uniref:Uncharacterized protein n=1 Tax=Glycomyces terrestris TaxID=2493553 RepID=A0A426V379_9ACTN|nr:DUF6463 family protein [Glycomyces terrestris]RRS01359.1 hypothetical protein EIW28_00855 [Glycomyces terrestris]